MLSATVTGGDKVQRDFAAMAKTSPAMMRRGIARGALLMERHLREVSLSGRGPENRTLRRDGGALARGVGQQEADDGLTRYIGTDRFYILTHEGLCEGVEGNHVVIRPRTASVLSFEVKGTQAVMNRRTGAISAKRITERVFTKLVRIRIRRPVLYTHEQTRGDAQREAWETVQKLLRGIGTGPKT